ncbi:nucleolar protein 58-like [Aedes albopictus]|uniref:CCHC-type domain-containing protein n=1 Tax=Aedes albopictus TaxID=7160 RepID=A0ABM1YRJ0_AEDAL
METSNYTEVVGENSDAFRRSGVVQRSPVTPLETAARTSSSAIRSEPQGSQRELGTPNQRVFTPTSKSSVVQESGLSEVRKKVNELYEFVKDKHNVHLKIKQLVVNIKSAVIAAEREQKALKLRVETAEKSLMEATERATVESMETPKSHRNTRSEKRGRDTPGEEEVPKKQRSEQERASNRSDDGWRTVENQQAKKKKKRKEKEEKKKEQKKKEKHRRPRERKKGDALIVEANDKTTYAALLSKLKEDPELKELGENVVKTRRTQKGEMLFELKKDPMIKSSAFRELVAKSLGSEANVRALSQETVVEIKDLDEVTTEEDLKRALTAQCNVEGPMVIRIRKSYGGTQTATIRLPADAANKLVVNDKVKVGWAVCSLRLAPRFTKQMERCYTCTEFGHHSRNCKDPDRSERCWRCGGNGHVARDCTKQPRCMLCKPEDGNVHPTGGFKCPAYKKARTGQQ